MQARKWRAIVLVVVMVSGGLAVAGHRAAAQTKQWLLVAGAGLSEGLGRGGEGAQQLMLNGARFVVESSTSARPLARVLEQERSACGAPRELENVWIVHEVSSREGSEEGVVACFRASEGLDVFDVPALLARFSERGDLSELGRFQYSYARATSDGRTALLRITPQGPLIVAAMFPPTEDAPGRDLPELPRPLNARRLLSVSHDQSPNAGVAAYRIVGESTDVQKRYLSRVVKAGYSVHGDGDARIVRSPTRTWVLAVARGPEVGSTELLLAGLP